MRRGTGHRSPFQCYRARGHLRLVLAQWCHPVLAEREVDLRRVVAGYAVRTQQRRGLRNGLVARLAIIVRPAPKGWPARLAGRAADANPLAGKQVRRDLPGRHLCKVEHDGLAWSCDLAAPPEQQQQTLWPFEIVSRFPGLARCCRPGRPQRQGRAHRHGGRNRMFGGRRGRRRQFRSDIELEQLHRAAAAAHRHAHHVGRRRLCAGCYSKPALCGGRKPIDRLWRNHLLRQRRDGPKREPDPNSCHATMRKPLRACAPSTYPHVSCEPMPVAAAVKRAGSVQPAVGK